MNVAREGERYQQGEAILRQFTRGLNSAYEPRLTPAELVHVGQRRHLCVCVCVRACVCACVCVCVCVWCGTTVERMSISGSDATTSAASWSCREARAAS